MALCRLGRFVHNRLERLGEIIIGQGPCPDRVITPSSLLPFSPQSSSLVPAHVAEETLCAISPAGCLCKSKGGPPACRAIALHFLRVGNTLPLSTFSGSPQEHAILNRRLTDYWKSRNRSLETTPYSIPSSQLHLLAPLGMEMPQDDVPTVPHGLHKSIEEGQLRRMRQFLAPGDYNMISVKDAKTNLLPDTPHKQYPAWEAKDPSRYPGKAISSTDFSGRKTSFLHDVSSVVYPHELVERLSKQNPDGHLFVTGMNPFEALEGVQTFEPSSHVLEYDLGNFNFVFTGSESESYFTSTGITVSWLRTSSVKASNGRVYHVVLLDYKLGHCLWHIFSGPVSSQDARTFGTGSMVYVPPAVSGTVSGEYVPLAPLSAVLSFIQRTPDLSTRNLSAKIAQVANASQPKATAREQWILTHLAGLAAPTKTWYWWLNRSFWWALYALSFQWQMFSPIPDIFQFVDERKRHRTIHPTPGGGWTPYDSWSVTKSSIPNHPAFLSRLSAFTGACASFLLPKIAIGEIISELFLRLPYALLWHKFFQWTDIKPLRAVLTVSIVVVTAILPGSVVKMFTRLSGHYWRQIWWPFMVASIYEVAVREVTGSPGAKIAPHVPGRGWAWQIWLWCVAGHNILPGLFPSWFLPWNAWVGGPWYLAALGIWLTVSLVEQVVPLLPYKAHPYEWWVYGPLYVPIIAWNCFKWFFTYPTHMDQVGPLSNLVAIPPPAQVVRARRNVDIPLPQVIVQPTNIPMGNPANALAVAPVGMTFVEWVTAVEAAYRTNVAAYPALAPGNHCFWDCVSSLGGTPHMWYSWFMAYTRRTPQPGDVPGQVSVPDMQVFSAASHIGLAISGLQDTLTQASMAGWPTLYTTLSLGVVNGLLHIELASVPAAPSASAPLARVLRTIHGISPAWFTHLLGQFNASAMDSVPRPTGFLATVLGDNTAPSTRNDVANAFFNAFAASPLLPAGGEGFNFDLQQGWTAPWEDLYTYGPPVAQQMVSHTAPGKMWQRFRQLPRNVNRWFKLPPDVKIECAKVGALRSQRVDNATRNNERPNPSRHSVLREELVKSVSKYFDLRVPAVSLRADHVTFVADVERATRLVSDLKANPSVLGPAGNHRTMQSLDAVVDTFRREKKTVSVPATLYMGCSGSGKTTATIAYLKSLDPEIRRNVRIVSHTESLRAQAKYKIDFPEFTGRNFPTLAYLLAEPSPGPIILDDAGKMWGGVVDLAVLANPDVSEIVVNGDPCQGISKFPIRGTQSEHCPTAIESVAHLCTTYATVSYRLFRILADTLGLYTTNPSNGHITHSVGPKAGIPVCTASPRYVQVLTGAGREAYTYESVQGEDFDREIEVDMTGLEGAVSDRTGYVALTRSKVGVFIRMEAMDPNSTIKAPPTGSDLVNALVYGLRAANSDHLLGPDPVVKACFYRHMHWTMPSLPWFAMVGNSLTAADFQNVTPACTYTKVTDFPSAETLMQDHQMASTGPIDTFDTELHPFDKQRRELPVRGELTDQFKEANFVNPHVHKRKDTATYFLSVESRLSHATYDDNLRKKALTPRTDMIEEYDRLMPNPPLWTPEKHSHYVDRAIEEYASHRTVHAVLDKLHSWDPDRTGSDIKISLKNQVIKKAEKKDKLNAIPGQLIHEYDIATTLGDAAYALFVEDELISAFPANFLFYRRMNPEQFREAYRGNWRVHNGVYSSDVTRWDHGCDAGMLNFDLHVFSRSAMPQSFIDGYCLRRLSSRSQHGPMATMQNSGDRFTWPLNSVRRAVVTSIVCQVTPEDHVAINGDDAAIDRCLVALDFPDSPWVFKNQNGLTGEFSGFELGGELPMYSDVGINYRALILQSRDPSAQDKWVNYFDLLRFCDMDSAWSIDTARLGHAHMQPDLFREYLPAPLRQHFPDVDFGRV